MTLLVENAITVLSAATVLADIAIIAVVLAFAGSLFFPNGIIGRIFAWLRRITDGKEMALSLGIVLFSIAGSVFFSEVAGFPACLYCWYQRVLLFPQAAIFAVALLKKDKGSADYSIVLSVIGALVALYQSYLQWGGEGFGSCYAGPGTIDCAKRYFIEFGYVTLPVMSLTAFAVILILMLSMRYRQKGS